jgi:uncharacterized RDD family membrane protein YckC
MDEKSRAGQPAGLVRRLAALFYDLLLVIALAFVATFAMLPLTGGEAILASTQGALAHAYHAIWLLAVFAYFGWCWTRSGQTLGMRAWRIALRDTCERRLGWTGAIVRFLLGAGIAFLAILGTWYLWHSEGWLQSAAATALLMPLALNFAWVPFDDAGRSLQDLVGGARVLRTG